MTEQTKDTYDPEHDCHKFSCEKAWELYQDFLNGEGEAMEVDCEKYTWFDDHPAVKSEHAWVGIRHSDQGFVDFVTTDEKSYEALRQREQNEAEALEAEEGEDSFDLPFQHAQTHLSLIHI